MFIYNRNIYNNDHGCSRPLYYVYETTISPSKTLRGTKLRVKSTKILVNNELCKCWTLRWRDDQRRVGDRFSLPMQENYPSATLSDTRLCKNILPSPNNPFVCKKEFESDYKFYFR